MRLPATYANGASCTRLPITSRTQFETGCGPVVGYSPGVRDPWSPWSSFLCYCCYIGGCMFFSFLKLFFLFGYCCNCCEPLKVTEMRWAVTMNEQMNEFSTVVLRWVDIYFMTGIINWISVPKIWKKLCFVKLADF